MRVLLDTHAFLWWIADSERLSATAHGLISAPENAVHVSAASAWEISTYRIGKFPEAAQVALDVAGVIASQGFEELPITVADAERSGRLPGPTETLSTECWPLRPSSETWRSSPRMPHSTSLPCNVSGETNRTNAVMLQTGCPQR